MGAALSLTPSDTVADLGFGGAVGLDRLLRRRRRAHVVGVERDSLDGAITVNTVYFLDELDRAVAGMAQVTRSSGRIVIGLGDPCRSNAASRPAAESDE